MLYEVITACRLVLGRLVRNVIGGHIGHRFGRGGRRRSNGFGCDDGCRCRICRRGCRITSYNVCYTKLLRAQVFYFENLPVADGKRNYGARHDHEAAHAKHIQSLWRAALQNVCARPDAGPREVLLHNAYLFLPANLLQDIGASLDGTRHCEGVTLTLLRNNFV